MLKDMPSSVQKAQRAAVWMLWGTLIICLMVPQGPFQLCMMLIAMICVAAGYHTAAISHFAQSLARSGLPDDWTPHDEKLAATFFAFPEAFILWRNMMASIYAVFSMMTYNMSPVQIYNLLQSPLPGPEGLETDSPQTVATSLSTPTWMYITAGCTLATLLVQCAVAQRRLNMLLRNKNDLEKYGNKGNG
ncbi:hypothetical protein BC629DRAFT_284367 [Irpex lacteus]|nr:hypothetical protein BC629DRAFT_284367 [Irpex lacteus]